MPLYIDQAFIVVSSAWRQIHSSYLYLKEWLEKFGMEIYDKTPYVGMERGDDITAWFMRHPGDWKYAILDDDDEIGPHMPHLVRTFFDAGLTMKDADRCMYLLQIWFNLSDEGLEDAIYDTGLCKEMIKGMLGTMSASIVS